MSHITCHYPFQFLNHTERIGGSSPPPWWYWSPPDQKTDVRFLRISLVFFNDSNLGPKIDYNDNTYDEFLNGSMVWLFCKLQGVNLKIEVSSFHQSFSFWEHKVASVLKVALNTPTLYVPRLLDFSSITIQIFTFTSNKVVSDKCIQGHGKLKMCYFT